MCIRDRTKTQDSLISEHRRPWPASWAKHTGESEGLDLVKDFLIIFLTFVGEMPNILLKRVNPGKTVTPERVS